MWPSFANVFGRSVLLASAMLLLLWPVTYKGSSIWFLHFCYSITIPNLLWFLHFKCLFCPSYLDYSLSYEFTLVCIYQLCFPFQISWTTHRFLAVFLQFVWISCPKQLLYFAMLKKRKKKTIVMKKTIQGMKKTTTVGMKKKNYSILLG